MSQACVRCGGQLTPGSAVCGQCGARASTPKVSESGAWGGLDIQRNAVPVTSGSTLSGQSAAALHGVPARNSKTGAAASQRISNGGAAVPKAAAAQRQSAVASPQRSASSSTSQRMAAGAAATPARNPATASSQRIAGSAVSQRMAAGPAAAQTSAAAARVAAAVQASSSALPGMMSNSDVSLDTGLTSFGDPFGGSGGDAGPAIDLVSMPPPKPQTLPPSVQLPAAGERPRGELAAAASSAVASAYGPPPEKLLQTVPYFVRVMLRKRELDAELASLTLHRKRLDTQAEEAMCAFAELIYAQREDPRLKSLAQQLRVVAESQSQVGQQAAAGARVADQHKRESDGLTADIQRVEREAAPVRKREAEAQKQADTLKAQVKRAEALMRKAEAEVKTLKTSTDVTAIDRIAALEAEREAHLGEIQTLNVQLLPLQEDLGVLRRELAKHMGTIAAVHEEQRKLATQMDRENERLKVSAGGARSAYREALRSLAAAALRAKLAGMFPEQAKAALEAEDRAGKKRESEDRQRAAAGGYDAAKYKQGMLILVGGTALTFVFFACRIMF